MEMISSSVCVTGGGGYLGSWLVRKLLKKGYVVHATLRSLGDESKTQLLKSFDGADERLRLFEADIYDAEKFEPAIQGCVCIFLVATPLQHYKDSSQYKDTTEASVSAVQSIIRACQRTNSVKRVIYTGTIFSASPWKEDGSGFKESMDESCWTPLHLPIPFINESVEYTLFLHSLFSFLPSFINLVCELQDYVHSKTITEKEFLRYKSREEEGGMEVVSLVCGVVGGETLQAFVPRSMAILLSPVTGEEVPYKQLQLLQELLGSVPLLHVDDVCEGHVFCMENASISGRFLCASAYPTADQIVGYLEHKFPKSKLIEGVERGRIEIPCSSTRLIDHGFKYNFNVEQILDGSVQTAVRLGVLGRNILP